MVNLFQAAAVPVLGAAPPPGLAQAPPSLQRETKMLQKAMFTIFVQLFPEIINAMIRGVSKVQLLGEV